MAFEVKVKQYMSGAIALRTIKVEGVKPENVIAKAIELAAFRYGRSGFDWDNAVQNVV